MDLSPLIKLIKCTNDLHKANFEMAAVIYTFIAIDVMCLCTTDNESQNKNDFISWVDKYFPKNISQPYQYRGIDLWAARCALLHSYGSEANDHRKNKDVMMFSYLTNESHHRYDHKIDNKLVLIGTSLFIDDFLTAAELFLNEVSKNENLRNSMAEKLPKILNEIPV